MLSLLSRFPQLSMGDMQTFPLRGYDRPAHRGRRAIFAPKYTEYSAAIPTNE